MFCDKLYLQCGKNPTCDNCKCGNMIVRTKQMKLCHNKKIKAKHTCKGCKVKMYCSKKCQKYDWKFKHRNECVVFGLQELSDKQYGVVHELSTMFDGWFKRMTNN